MPCALSRNARTLMVRCLLGEEIEASDGPLAVAASWRRRACWKHIHPGRPAALRRRREFLPHDGPLSRSALAQLRRYLDGDREVTDANRAPPIGNSPLQALMAAGHSFVRGDEATYDLTRKGFERKAELLALIGLKEAG